MQESPMRLRTVLTWVDMIQFDMAKQVLEEAQIPFDTMNRSINRAQDPAGIFDIQLLSLRVREQDFEQAKTLLEETVGRGVVKGEE